MNVSLAKPTRGVWVVTTNIAGYLPESDPLLFESWSAAAAGIAAHMSEYADRDDDAAADTMPEDAFEDDQPAMLATVASILRDNSPAAVGQPWGAWVEDNSGRRIVFEMTWVRDVTTVCISHDDSHGCCDYCGLWVEEV